jgi:hypothetical protein
MDGAALSRSCHAILRTTGPGGCRMIHGEPKLEELLSEPIVLLAARSAGLSPQQLKALCKRIRSKLRSSVRELRATSSRGIRHR